jgi:acetyl esterase/lipase
MGWTTGGQRAGLRVTLALGLLLSQAQGVGHAPVATAAAPLPCTATPHTLPYGPDARQVGVLRVPAGPGPHPVAVVIHGGCWLNAFTLDLMEGVSAALTAAGLATWNIAYRRLGDPGGGYPPDLHGCWPRHRYGP